jgi:two-component system cell cycle response regulator CtrA
MTTPQKKLVLYVEDEIIQAKIFSQIIENEVSPKGYKVIVFNNGSELIDLINDKHPTYKISQFNVILLDLSMHDISGFDMLKQIKSKQVLAPVAVLTAHEDESMKNQAIIFGAKDYFVKGKDIDELTRLKNFICEF